MPDWKISIVISIPGAELAFIAYAKGISMPYAQNGTTKIYFETRGADDGIPVVFIEGFTMQLIGWNPRLIERFAADGLRPILLDNRDVGLTDRFGGEDDLDGGYTVTDMADDVVAVADALGLDSVHVIGQSMGGMIAQNVALRHPARVRSLGLLYTAPGLPGYAKDSGGPDLSGKQPRQERNAAIERFVERERVSGSPGFPFDEVWIRQLAGDAYDRAYAPDGISRQGAAMRNSEQWRDRLGEITMPTAIIHGYDDAHIDSRASVDMHLAVPGSELHIFAGMGHELPEPIWDDFVEILGRTARRGEIAR